jgi:hypothetical protein
MFDIIELQHELNQIRLEKEATNSGNTKAEEESNYSQVRARTARTRRNNDIDMLLKRGTTPLHVSEILGISIDHVKARVARLEKDEEERREFLQLGIMSDSLQTGGYVAIFR